MSSKPSLIIHGTWFLSHPTHVTSSFSEKFFSVLEAFSARTGAASQVQRLKHFGVRVSALTCPSAAAVRPNVPQ